MELEVLTGKKATRKFLHFGKWNIHTPHFTFFNNPFGLDLGYTRTENEFEVFEEDTSNIHQRVPLSKLKQMILTKQASHEKESTQQADG